MSWWTDLISGGVDKVITATGAAIDSIVTSDEERIKLQNELAIIQAKSKLDSENRAAETEIKIEAELTARLQADMSSEEPMAKKVRPLSLIYLLTVVSIFAAADGNVYNFTIASEYIDLFKALLLLAFTFYFGSRGLEKIASIIWKK